MSSSLDVPLAIAPHLFGLSTPPNRNKIAHFVPPGPSPGSKLISMDVDMGTPPTTPGKFQMSALHKALLGIGDSPGMDSSQRPSPRSVRRTKSDEDMRSLTIAEREDVVRETIDKLAPALDSAQEATHARLLEELRALENRLVSSSAPNAHVHELRDRLLAFELHIGERLDEVENRIALNDAGVNSDEGQEEMEGEEEREEEEETAEVNSSRQDWERRMGALEGRMRGVEKRLGAIEAGVEERMRTMEIAVERRLQEVQAHLVAGVQQLLAQASPTNTNFNV